MNSTLLKVRVQAYGTKPSILFPLACGPSKENCRFGHRDPTWTSTWPMAWSAATRFPTLRPETKSTASPFSATRDAGWLEVDA